MSLAILTSGIFVVGLAGAAAMDLASRKVPNWWTVPLAAAGFATQLRLNGALGLLLSLSGMAVAFGLLIVPFAQRWMGGGDVKVAMAAGAWLGPLPTVWMVLIGLVLGGVLALVVTAAGGRGFSREVASNMKVALYTRTVPDVPRRSDRQVVPLAVAIGAAAVWTYFRGVYA